MNDCRYNYEFYKLRVLSKTSGANIHYIKGRLNIILNNLSNIDYWYSVNKKSKIKTLYEITDEALKEIFKYTGEIETVEWFLGYFLKDI